MSVAAPVIAPPAAAPAPAQAPVVDVPTKDEPLKTDDEDVKEPKTKEKVPSYLTKFAETHSDDWNEKMYKWFESGEHYDCTFNVGPLSSKQEAIKCHRLILATASPAFERMLFGFFLEAEKGPDDLIDLPDVEPEIFKLCMRFVYGKDLTGIFDSLETSMKLFEFAAKWQIAGLDKMTAMQCLKFKHDAGDLISLHVIFSQCQMNIEEEVKEIMSSIIDRGSEVLSVLQLASEQTVKTILSSDKLNIFSEQEIFDALVAWGEAQIDNPKPGSATVRAKINHLLKFVRFSNFSTKEFARLSTKSMILTTEEKSAIMSALELKLDSIALPGFYMKPKWRSPFNPETVRVVFEYTASGFEETVDGDEEMVLYTRLTVNEPVYLLSIGIYSLCYLNPAESVEVVVELQSFDDDKLVMMNTFTSDCNRFSHARLADSMVRLLNPCLLEKNKPYVLLVYHMKRKMMVPINKSVPSSVTKDKLKVDYNLNNGDVFALEFGWPQ